MKAEDRATLAHIQIKTHALTAELLSGMYLAAFRGKGLEFEEIRPFVAGDDIRSIDWKATAKTHTPFVKVFREERELKIMLIVDVSAPLNFGSNYGSKRQVQAEIGAILAYSAIKNHDKVGLLLFSETVQKYIPPGAGIKHVYRLINALIQHHGASKKNLPGALEFFGRLSMKGTVCFVMSDFLSSEYSKQVKLIARKHDLIGVCIQDPLDRKLPEMGIVRLRDLETGEEREVDTNDRHTQEIYQKEREQLYITAKKHFTTQGAGWIEIMLDTPYAPVLRKFFKMRAKKRR